MPSDPVTNTRSRTDDPDEESAKARRLPEAVSLGGGLWFFAVAVEIIHQLLATAMRLLNPGELTAIAEEAAGAGATDALTSSTVMATVVTAGTFSIAVMVFLGWAVNSLIHNNRRAKQLRLLLTYFSVFFAIRVAALFAAPAGTGDSPLWFGTVDGALQILTACAAVTGVILLFREESSRFIAAAEPKNSGGNR